MRTIAPRVRGRRRRLLRLPLVALAVASLVACSGEEGARRPGPRPNVVLITIDTLRADHLSSYGYFRSTSPSIDRLAESGLLFERAIAPAPWTLPSLASLHTALAPREHGAITARTPLRPDVTTLAEALQAVGYETMAIATHVFVGRRYGLDQGFDVFDESLVLGEAAVTSPEATQKALDALHRTGKEPFFLWVHYFDPHYDYVRHPEYGFVRGAGGSSPDRLGIAELRRFEGSMARARAPAFVDTVKAIYDEEIAFTDAAIGRLVDGIDAMELARPTVFVLTADHGEYFMGRGRFGHGQDVYDPLVHVPLVISGAIDPELQGRRVDRAVGTANVAHTVAALARMEGNPFGGRDLVELARSPVEVAPVFSFGCYAWGTDARKLMVESGGWKLIKRLDDARFELYDVERDPEERQNQWTEQSPAADAVRTPLREALDAFAARETTAAPTIGLSRREISRLRALGYVR